MSDPMRDRTSSIPAAAEPSVSEARETQTIDPARWLRAVRRARTLSQRELAALAGVPLSTVAGIEAGRRSPSVATLQRIMAATDHRLAFVDVRTGVATDLDDVHDAIRDAGGRRLPAHLAWGDRPTANGSPWWWGWDQITWFDPAHPLIPAHTWRQRPRERRGAVREHPWFGQFQGRNSCFGPADRLCERCLGDCRYRPDERAAQSRPSEGPPEVPPAWPPPRSRRRR